MWELYDALIDEIPENLTLTDVVCDQTWTAARASDGNLGLAMTTDVQTLPLCGEPYIGMSLKRAATLVKSWNFIEAGIGMAAINSFYNAPARMEALQSLQPDDRYCTFDIPVEGKRLVLVGHLRNREKNLAGAKSVVILERRPQEGDYPDSACEYFLPEADLVLITGSAFVNKTMPRLLQLASHAEVIITGPSVPMAPQLLQYGIRRIAGLVATDREGAWRFASLGIHNPPYRFGQRFYLE